MIQLKNGKKTDTNNGCNIEYKGYRENGKYVTTDNFIVTSFKNEKEEVIDIKASAAILTSGASEPGNLFMDEIIIDTDVKVKSVFERVRLTDLPKTEADTA